ncbi:transcription factor Adf-1-like [Liolophura sinensis]|uniref:transcription factor Adf-1-like n=1 Tax=Liolophura sinensis TaxID=3198878 RepID=UPI0031587AC8
MPGQWSTEEIKQLICEVEERPTLWNVLVDEYRDRVKKSDSWKQVAEALNKEQCEVEKKFHTLRTQYAAEVKAEEKRKSGSEGVVKKSKWQYMEALSFLGAGMKKRQGSSSEVGPLYAC